MSQAAPSPSQSASSTALWGRIPTGFFAELFTGVQWSPAFIALLYYTYAILTYHATGARYAMVIAMASLLFDLSALRWTPMLTWLSGWLVWVWVCALMVGGSGDALMGAQEITKLVIIAFVIFNAVRTPQQIRFYIAFVIGCFLLYPFRGAMINYVAGYNLFGRAIWNFVYANPNDLAAHALLVLSLTLGSALVWRHRLWRIGAVGASGGFVLLVLLTQSRAAFIALVSTSLIGMAIFRKGGRSLVIMGALSVLSLPFVPDSAWKRLSGITKMTSATGMKGIDDQHSAEQRYQVLQVALRMAKDHPLVGVGPQQYPAASRDYGRRMATEYPLAANVIDPHNSYLRLWTELGVPGLLLFLAAIFVTVRTAWATSRRVLAAGDVTGSVIRVQVLGLVAYLLMGFFNSFPYIVILYIQLAVIGSVVTLANTGLARTPHPLPGPEVPRRSLRLAGNRGGLAVVR